MSNISQVIENETVCRNDIFLHRPPQEPQESPPQFTDLCNLLHVDQQQQLVVPA